MDRSATPSAAPALMSHLHLCSCHLLLIRLIIFSLRFVPPPVLFSCPLPSCFSLALSGERYAVALKSQDCGSMGGWGVEVLHRDNRNAALTGAIELIRSLCSDNVITAVLRPLFPPPQPALYTEQEMGGGGNRASFKRGLTHQQRQQSPRSPIMVP